MRVILRLALFNGFVYDYPYLTILQKIDADTPSVGLESHLIIFAFFSYPVKDIFFALVSDYYLIRFHVDRI
jgi:hypothetical protein